MRPSNSSCARHLRERADQLLARLVGGVRLAGEQEQDRPLAVGEQAAQAVEVVEEQRGALVGGEAPPEADGEHVRVRRVGVAQQPLEVRLAAVVARVLHARCGGAPCAACCALMSWRTLQKMWSGMSRIFSQMPGWPRRCIQPTPRKRSSTSLHSGARKVGTCTPLVT